MWKFALMGDSGNNNNDDNDNDDHNESGSIFGKQCSASFKANKIGTPREPVGHRNCLQRVAVPATLLSQPSLWLSFLNTYQYPWCPKYLFLSKTKQRPPISTILTEEKIHYQGCSHVTFSVALSGEQYLRRFFSWFSRGPQSLLYS